MIERQPLTEHAKSGILDSSVEMTPLRVLIADSNQTYRTQIKHFLIQHKNFQLVGECCEGVDVPLLCKTLKPDVAIVDLHLPRMNGVEVTHHLTRISPRTKILILADQDHAHVLETIRSGASGYLLKTVKLEQIIEALRIIAQGGYYIHPIIMGRLVAELRRLSQRDLSFQRIYTENQPINWKEVLTYREMEVLRLITQGKNNRVISEHLYISEKTVKNHVSNILFKLNVQDRTQAVLMAIKCGWVQLV